MKTDTLRPMPMTKREIADLVERARSGSTRGQVENGLKTRARHARNRGGVGCCARFTYGDGTHDLDCRVSRRP